GGGVKLTVSRSGNNFVMSWPASAASYVLESANTLNAPITWSQVTTPPAQLVGDQKVVTVGTTNASRFFRLRATGPQPNRIDLMKTPFSSAVATRVLIAALASSAHALLRPTTHAPKPDYHKRATDQLTD